MLWHVKIGRSVSHNVDPTPGSALYVAYCHYLRGFRHAAFWAATARAETISHRLTSAMPRVRNGPQVRVATGCTRCSGMPVCATAPVPCCQLPGSAARRAACPITAPPLSSEPPPDCLPPVCVCVLRSPRAAWHAMERALGSAGIDDDIVQVWPLNLL